MKTSGVKTLLDFIWKLCIALGKLAGSMVFSCRNELLLKVRVRQVG